MTDASARAGPEVIERTTGTSGELCLRRRGDELEIISNGVFLMSTHNGASERALVDEALRAADRPRRLLLGGLGIGFSLARACADARLEHIVVVELEPAVVTWHEHYLAGRLGTPLEDPRVELVVGDLADRLDVGGDPYDAVCLDVDNAPDWTVRPGNDRLYTDTGLARLARALHPGGALGVWSAHPHAPFAGRLQAHFASVERVHVAAPRGGDDLVYVARRGRGGRDPAA